VTFADAGELATAVHYLDVAHPPGFPLYLLLGKAFSLILPWGRLVQRLNAFSAVSAAAAVGLFYGTLLWNLSSWWPHRSTPRSSRRRKSRRRRRSSQAPVKPLPWWVFPVSAAAAAGLLATSRTFWEQATITEVYALNMVATSGLFLLLAAFLRSRQREDQRTADRLLAGAALLAGLGLGNHLTLLFVAATVFLVAWLEEGQAFWRWPRLLALTGLFVLGLSVYLYLPVRAHANTPMNWGNPDTLVRFWRHVSGKQYQVNFAPSWTTWIGQLKFFLPRLWQEFSPLPLVLAPLGLYRLFRRRRSLAWGSSVGAALVLFYALSYDIAEDQETYYMLFFFLAVLWMAHGMIQVLEWLQAGTLLAKLKNNERLLRGTAAVLFLLLFSWPLFLHWPYCNRSAYTYAEAYARDLLDHLPPDSFVLTRAWNLFAPAHYLQQVEGLRADVILVDQELLRRSWYLDTLERRFPEITQRIQGAIGAYRDELLKFENDLPYDFDTIQARYQGLSNALLNTTTLQGRPVLMTPEVEYRFGQDVNDRFVARIFGQPPEESGGVGEVYLWVPQALGFLLETEIPSDVSWETFDQPALSDGRRHDALTQEMIEKYAQFWVRKGLYLHASADCENAVRAYEQALSIDDSLEIAVQGIQDCQERLQP
jgi:hypothetical protein